MRVETHREVISSRADDAGHAVYICQRKYPMSFVMSRVKSIAQTRQVEGKIRGPSGPGGQEKRLRGRRKGEVAEEVSS